MMKMKNQAKNSQKNYSCAAYQASNFQFAVQSFLSSTIKKGSSSQLRNTFKQQA
jgi:hypothetical protein